VYRGALHETPDQDSLFAPITKHRVVADTARFVGPLVANALKVASTVPSGPVYLQIPTDFLTGAAGSSASYASSGASRPDYRAACDAIAQSERPLMWVGGGARDATEGVDSLARALGAPVITTYQGRGVLPAGHDHLVPAPPHEPEVIELVARADLAIVIGSDLDYMNTMGWQLPLPAARVAINVDAADATKNIEIDAVVEAAAADVLPLLAGTIEHRAPWAGDLAALGVSIRDRLRNTPETASSIEFLERTESALPSDAVVFADMCIPGYWLAGHFGVARPRGLHYPMGWGTLGFAFPAAIGAAVAHAGRCPVIAFAGDGGMLFAIGELATVAQERLPLTIVVVDDGGYGMLRFGHENEPNGSDLAPVDFAAVARGFGIDATAVSGTGSDYEIALAESARANEPRLLHVSASLYPPVTTSPRWPMRSS
jgi:acetolactate synthase-1/2/3 large subunit